eukprot:GSMAST32.ASY1.ANO1.2447.1 assembled CDS
MSKRGRSFQREAKKSFDNEHAKIFDKEHPKKKFKDKEHVRKMRSFPTSTSSSNKRKSPKAQISQSSSNQYQSSHSTNTRRSKRKKNAHGSSNTALDLCSSSEDSSSSCEFTDDDDVEITGESLKGAPLSAARYKCSALLSQSELLKIVQHVDNVDLCFQVPVKSAYFMCLPINSINNEKENNTGVLNDALCNLCIKKIEPEEEIIEANTNADYNYSLEISLSGVRIIPEPTSDGLQEYKIKWVDMKETGFSDNDHIAVFQSEKTLDDKYNTLILTFDKSDKNCHFEEIQLSVIDFVKSRELLCSNDYALLQKLYEYKIITVSDTSTLKNSYTNDTEKETHVENDQTSPLYSIDTSNTNILSSRSTRASTRLARRNISHIREEPNKVYTVYAPENSVRDSITFTHGDMDRLDPGEFLNDNVIDFYLRYCLQKKQKKKKKKSKATVYIFSSHFFKRLIQGCYEDVKSWTKNIDIFSYDFLFFPINMRLHWSLAVICNPGNMMGRFKKKSTVHKPVFGIALFDSLMCHSLQKVKKQLFNYMTSELKARKNLKTSLSIKEIFAATTKSPQQDNSCDCGVYVCKNVEILLTDLDRLSVATLHMSKMKAKGESKLKIKKRFDKVLKPNAYEPQDAARLRQDLRRIITQIKHKNEVIKKEESKKKLAEKEKRRKKKYADCAK